MYVSPAPIRPPAGFTDVGYHHEWLLGFDRDEVWQWLCDPDTFVDGQIWPWEVEFLANEDGPGPFRPGVYNAHTGPFMSFTGILGDIDEGRYRDLHYFYGSYALSVKLFRPTRLQFWFEDRPGATHLRLRVDAHVRSWAVGPWKWLMRTYWPLFGRFASIGIARHGLRRSSVRV